MYDVLIIGYGPAGMSAAYSCAQDNLKVALIGKITDSKGWQESIIKNYPGFPDGITGKELNHLFQIQLNRIVSDRYNELVSTIHIQDGFNIITESGKKFFAKSIILATGNETNLTFPDIKTPGLFTAGELKGTNTILQALGSGALVASETIRFVKTMPNLGI